MHEEFTPAEGRSVVYQLAEGEYRPAQIVKAWTTEALKTCNLVVFLDGSNDARYTPYDSTAIADVPVVWKTSVVLGDDVGQYLPRKPA